MLDAFINTVADLIPTVFPIAITAFVLKTIIKIGINFMTFEETNENKTEQTKQLKQTKQQKQNKKLNTFDELALIVKYMKMKRS